MIVKSFFFEFSSLYRYWYSFRQPVFTMQDTYGLNLVLLKDQVHFWISLMYSIICMSIFTIPLLYSSKFFFLFFFFF
jgi:hypothetical protein